MSLERWRRKGLSDRFSTKKKKKLDPNTRRGSGGGEKKKERQRQQRERPKNFYSLARNLQDLSRVLTKNSVGPRQRYLSFFHLQTDFRRAVEVAGRATTHGKSSAKRRIELARERMGLAPAPAARSEKREGRTDRQSTCSNVLLRVSVSLVI